MFTVSGTMDLLELRDVACYADHLHSIQLASAPGTASISQATLNGNTARKDRVPGGKGKNDAPKGCEDYVLSWSIDQSANACRLIRDSA
jgi:hypothetical protein